MKKCPICKSMIQDGEIRNHIKQAHPHIAANMKLADDHSHYYEDDEDDFLVDVGAILAMESLARDDDMIGPDIHSIAPGEGASGDYNDSANDASNDSNRNGDSGDDSGGGGK